MDRTTDRPLNAANADTFTAGFSIGRGRLNEGAERIPNGAGKADEIWLASISVEGEADTAVYLRMSGRRQMMAELICATLGRALGLPIPPPYIVTVDRRKLPRSKLWAQMDKGQKQCHMFASGAIEGKGSFSQLLQSDSAYARRLIQGWKQYPEAAVFDELLANVDRNYSNMLFRANIIWLIDHAEAFGGASADLFDLGDIAHAPYRNQLLDDFKDDFNLDRRNGILAIAREMLDQVKEMDLQDMLQAIGEEHISTSGGIAEVLNFFGTRMLHTVPLLCQRLGLPQLPLNPSESTSPCRPPAPNPASDPADRRAAPPMT